MRQGTEVLVEHPDKFRLLATVFSMPTPERLGVVLDTTGQQHLVPRGSRVQRLHTYDDAEVRYVYTCDADHRVWEIIAFRWTQDGSVTDVAELNREGFRIYNEEELQEHIDREDWEERTEGYYAPPDLSRTGREL